MMQLNLMGLGEESESNWFEEIWVPTLKYEPQRLDKLIFGSAQGPELRRRYYLEKKHARPCAVCVTAGRYDKMTMIRDTKVTKIPCRNSHLAHVRCVQEWCKESFVCPECPQTEQAEFIL